LAATQPESSLTNPGRSGQISRSMAVAEPITGIDPLSLQIRIQIPVLIKKDNQP
jgi:hypothetical protein